MVQKKSTRTGVPLVIVESPAKARTISGFLGRAYAIEASIGHIRDLPHGAKEIPEEFKGEDWAHLGVNVHKDFEPVYVIPHEKAKQVRMLKDKLKDASDLYLATDEDREGEAISWHLCEVLKPKVPVHRLVFHEITEEAIREALAHPRQIDDDLVRAQETRRIIDRLYGYEVSPLLWRKIRPRLSAGRVQSVAVRLIVERERQRRAFVSATYWDLLGTIRHGGGDEFEADAGLGRWPVDPVQPRFRRRNGKAQGRQPGCCWAKARPASWPRSFARAECRVADFEDTPYTTRPPRHSRPAHCNRRPTANTASPPGTRCRLPRALYENGHITYMRTDSTNLATVAIQAARDLVASQYGREYLPPQAITYQTKVKNAQEAHEAIRPAGHPFTMPDTLRSSLSPDAFKLFDLIWKRTIASQMVEARCRRITISVEADGATFQVERQNHRLPRLPAGVRGRLRRSGSGIGGPGGTAAGDAERGRLDLPRHGPEGPHHPAAQPLQRSGSHPGSGRNGYRPAKYVRSDHRDHLGPRLCLQTRQRIGAYMDRLCHLPIVGTASAEPGRLSIHRGDGRRARRHQPGRGEAPGVFADLLFRQRPSRA